MLGNLMLGAGSQIGLVLVFIIAASIVVFAGLKLGEYGDALGERTGIGSGIVGLIFLALVTSLPDLTVSVSAAIDASIAAAALSGDAARRAVSVGADLAAGNLLGSDLFNLMIFVLIDIFQGEGALMFRLSRKNIMSAACGALMVGVLFFGYAIDVSPVADVLVPGLDVGVVMLMIPVAYVGCLVVLNNLEKRDHGMDGEDYGEPASETDQRLVTMRRGRFYSTLVLLSVFIVASGIWMSFIGSQMAKPTEMGGFGLNASFVGTIFLAIATSLPEVVVCFSLVRLKAYDAAAGNVLGSNIFNIAGLFLVDIALRGHSLLGTMNHSLLVTMALIVMLTNIVIMGLIMRTRRSFLHIGVDVWLMLLIYIAGNAAVYFLG